MAVDDSSKKTYRGNCHCKAFVYEVKLPEVTKGYECNCSICLKKGYIWAHPQSADDFTVVKGSLNSLTTYKFGKGVYEHRFCPTCGSPPLCTFQDKPPIVNVRSFQGNGKDQFDLRKIERVLIKGADTGENYQPPAYTGPEPEFGFPSDMLYHGSCHCGKVTLALKFPEPSRLGSTEPYNFQETFFTPETENCLRAVSDCNCSVCQKAGCLWIYPEVPRVVIQGREHLTHWGFGMRLLDKAFCKICGVYIANLPFERSEEEMAALPEQLQGAARRTCTMSPINSRCLNGIDAPSEIKAQHLDGWAFPFPYEEP